jgi:NAD(P)-dependent dehydrogenase (short-subunit alcohol dehydrogenase family)
VKQEGDLQGRVAVITGARGGIGRAIARLFAEQGAQLCLADLSAPAASDPWIGESRDLFDAVVDVTARSSVDAMVAQTLQRFGRIDVLVNVAGVVSFGAAASLPEAEWDRVLTINLKGTFLCCQAVIAPMQARRYGRIINMGSVVGKNGGNARPWLDPAEQLRSGNIAYGVSKAGVHALTSFLARELAAHGITVNAIAPGPIATEMTRNFPEALRAMIPVGRLGSPEDVANAALFLAGEGAGFVTGEVLDLNGGIWPD